MLQKITPKKLDAISKLLVAVSKLSPCTNFSYKNECDLQGNEPVGEQIFVWMVSISHKGSFWNRHGNDALKLGKQLGNGALKWTVKTKLNNLVFLIIFENADVYNLLLSLMKRSQTGPFLNGYDWSLFSYHHNIVGLTISYATENNLNSWRVWRWREAFKKFILTSARVT